MGEIPIFTSKAHVFIMDQVTKKSWIPASKSAVGVNFFFDSSRNSYRIISVDGSKAIINSTLMPEMTFTKTSAKFGQWADLHANTVYGLGFGSEVLLTTFLEQYEDIRQRARLLKEQTQRITTINKTHTDENIDVQQIWKQEDVVTNDAGDDEITSSISDDSTARSLTGLTNLQLQNEKLKLSLTQSSGITKKLEMEVQTLKNTNAHLTEALQESMSNADQWHRQLVIYKENNEKLKKQSDDLMTKNSKDMEMKQMNSDLLQTIERLKKENTEKCQECNILQQRISVLTVIEKQHNQCAAKMKMSCDENFRLKDKMRALESEITKISKEQSVRQFEVKKYLKQVHEHVDSIAEIGQKLQTAI